MPYKILMVAPTSFFSDTGCHVRILEEINALQEAGHKVVVCTYHMGSDLENVNIARSLDVPWKRGVQVGSSRHKIYFDAMLAIKAALVAIREKPDIIHGHVHEGALIGWSLKLLKFNKIPLIFDFQGSMTSEMVDHHFINPKGRFYKPAFQLEKVINQLPDSIITSTYNGAKILKQQFSVKPDKITTITDRVNSSRFHPFSSPEDRETVKRLKMELGIPLDRKIVVYLGLLAPYQGTNILLEAAQLIKRQDQNIHFVVMGYPGVDSYRDLARYLDIQDRVTFPGRIPYHDAPKYLAMGDIAVAPKMSATEGAGKITNYMAMGLPTVVFESPVTREILGDCGVYAKFGDSNSLAEKITGLIKNEELQEILGEKLRDKALAELGWDQALSQLEGVYAAALEKVGKSKVANSSSTPSGVKYTADNNNYQGKNKTLEIVEY